MTNLARKGSSSLEWSASPPNQLDPEWQRVTQLAEEAGLSAGDPAHQTLREARAANRAYNLFWNMALPMVRDAGEVALEGPSRPFRLRVMHPPGDDWRQRRPALLYFHGGGFAFNGLETHERVMRLLCRRTGATVIGVGYHLSPEYRYPYQLNEAVQALDWVISSANGLGIDPGRIGVAGDSAGATLALSLALHLRDQGRPEDIKLCLLFYGMYSTRLDTASHHAYGLPPFGLTSSKIDWFWRAYLPDEQSWTNPLAVPWHADLAGLPQTIFVAAGLDCLRDDTLDLYARASEAKVRTSLVVHDRLPHSFLQQTAVVAAADNALSDAASRAAAILV